MAFEKQMIRFGRALHFALIFAPILSGCGTTRLDQTSDSMLQRRAQYAQLYLDESRERYTALLQRIKADLDAHKAGRRSETPVIDYLIISGGGDFGAFGAGFLKGWRTIPKSDPLSRPRFDVA